MSPPIPLEAAGVILARDRLPQGTGIDVLLICRPTRSRVAGGAYVFPGGRVEQDDWGPGIARLCPGLDREDAARTLGTVEPPERAVGFWVAAVRELFEETGLLLAYDLVGALVRSSPDTADPIRRLLQAHRAAQAKFVDLLHGAGLRLATDRLHYFSHWITPEERLVRNDARFFVAASPPQQEVVLDPDEATAFQWVRPADALAAQARGVLPMRFPTMKTLGSLTDYRDLSSLIASTEGKTIEAIRPRVVGEKILLPGEPGYY